LAWFSKLLGALSLKKLREEGIFFGRGDWRETGPFAGVFEGGCGIFGAKCVVNWWFFVVDLWWICGGLWTDAGVFLSA
jgi:hypothetical protein